MAYIKVSQLPVTTTIADTDVIMVIDNGGFPPVSKQITFGNFLVAMTGSASFGAAISGFLPVKNISGSGYINVSSSSGNFIVSVTGLQPSGNYSVVGHTHTVNNITDITSAGSGIVTASSFSAQNKLGWTLLTNTTGVAGGQYYSPKTSIFTPGTLTLSDPATASDGDFYIVIKHSGNGFNGGTVIGGVNYSLDSNAYIIRMYNTDSIFPPSASWKSYTLDNYHTHVSANITNFNSSVSGLLPSISGSGYAVSSFSNNIYTISITGLQPSGNYSVVGHTHIASNITDFDSSVSGLLPVKNIVSGTGINVSSLSGTYTIAVTGIASLIGEEVDDRVAQLLVEGTGVNLTYNDASGTLTIDNLHTEINILGEEPQGFVNRQDSLISFNDSTRTFTIQPAISGGSYVTYVKGIKVVKNTVETVTIGSGTDLNFLHFSTTAPYQLQTKTTFFDFVDDVPIAYIHWNSGINQSTFFGEERHGIRMDTSTHKWIHNTFGMQYINGLSISYSGLSLDGSLDSHAQISLSDGILYQEDIIINVTDDNGINSSEEFVQPLSPIAYTPVYYHEGTTGQWVRDSGIPFPLKYNGTGPLYNLYSPGPPPNWTIPNVDDNKYFAMWLVATNDINDPILAIMGQRQDANLIAAQDNNIWSDINLTNIPVFEFKPMYRLIFRADNAYTNTPKATLQSVLDLRTSVFTTVAGVTQNDHGSLFGLGDDDHNQYVHINTARTITAVHTFTNGLNASGLISVSGNLNVSATGDINVLKINKLYHNNLSVATGVADSSLLITIVDPTGTPTTQVISGSGLRNSLLNQPAVLRFRQGTEAERILFTPASGEPIWTTDSQKFYIGDGSTVGGDFMGPSPYARSSGTQSITALNTNCVSSGDYSSVLGGQNNKIQSVTTHALICGGQDNLIDSDTNNHCSVIGGRNNKITGYSAYRSTIVGGYGNTISSSSSYNSVIGGGEGNTLSGNYNNDCVIAGGASNTISSTYNSFSTIGGGESNTISSSPASNIPGACCTIAGGSSNIIFGDQFYNTIGGGYNNEISSQTYAGSTIAGGFNNTISNDYSGGSTIGGGTDNIITSIGSTLTPFYSCIPGGLQAKVTRHGELSHSAGKFSNEGDAQHTTLIARRTTIDATANQILNLDNSSLRLILPAKTTWTFEVKLSAYNDTDSAGAGWIFRGAIRRNGSNGTALIGSIIEENWKDTAMSSTAAGVVADDTNEALEIRVTGLASKNIRWVAVVDISQVSYGTP